MDNLKCEHHTLILMCKNMAMCKRFPGVIKRTKTKGYTTFIWDCDRVSPISDAIIHLGTCLVITATRNVRPNNLKGICMKMDGMCFWNIIGFEGPLLNLSEFHIQNWSLRKRVQFTVDSVKRISGLVLTFGLSPSKTYLSLDVLA